MGKKYLIDTNTVIDLLSNRLSEKATDWLEQLIDNQEHCLSIINKIELLSYEGASEEMRILEAFIVNSELIAITDSIVDTTIIKRRTKKVKLPDALIAATVQVYNLTIITRNTKDFVGLECINPYEL
jgi:predicted nucleic acid-binding protein